MIYKYPLKITEGQELVLPKRAVILTVQNQADTLCLWALVDSNEKQSEVRVIRIVGTGQRHIPASSLRYIATAQIQTFVWHVFEEILP